MTDTGYSLNPFEVKIGDMAKWINQDTSPHTAPSGQAGEAESSIAPDVLSEAQRFSIIFEQPGTTHTSAYYIQIW